MRILMLGVNHRTAPVELRERLALSGDRLASAIDQLRAAHPAVEVVILSTCNRTELYVSRAAHEPPNNEELIAFLARFCGVEQAALTAAAIHRENDQAVAQLFRVAAGLDSMVLGEPQVLGQVKRAYEFASVRGAVGAVLHRVFQQAVAVGKHARTATGIGAGRMSVGSAAVDLARQVFERFDDKTVVCVGAGEMAKLALRHFHALRPAKLWLTNRTHNKAEALAARLGLHGGAGGGGSGGSGGSGGARAFEALDELLIEADVVLSGTGAARPIITAARFRPLLRKRRSRPLFIIDIALPRDVEPAVGSLKNVYLYNLDDLQAVVEQTRGQRGEQAEACEKILFEAVRACMADIHNRDLGRLIRALRDRLHELARAEEERTGRKIESVTGADVSPLLEEHTHRLINKILHVPLSQLDRVDGDAPLGFYAAALRRLFDLKEETTTEEPSATDPLPASPQTEDVEVQPPPASSERANSAGTTHSK